MDIVELSRCELMLFVFFDSFFFQLPPPEERANMSQSDMKAWKAKQRRKRKALKQRENREKKKRMFEDIQSMLTTLPSVEVKVPGKDEDMESDKASGAGAGKIQMVKEADQMDMVLGITSCDVICSGGFFAPSMNHDISDKKGLPEDGKVKVPGMSLEPVKSSEVVYAPQGFVANGAILSGNDLSNTVDDARVIDVIKDTHDLEALVLSEEYEFNLFDELIGNLEEVKIHVVENEFDRRFNPVDTNEEDDMETDISVIDNSFLDYQLPL